MAYGPARPKEAVCPECGKTYIWKTKRAARCPECRKKRDSLRAKKRRGYVKPPQEKKESNYRYCKTCVYYGKSTSTCDFLWTTGERRGCPSGKNCTRKVTRNRGCSVLPEEKGAESWA